MIIEQRSSMTLNEDHFAYTQALGLLLDYRTYANRTGNRLATNK